MILNEVGIRSLFDGLAEAEPRLTVVQQEQPDTPERDPDAETFLKLDGKRWGRDLELYASVIGMIGTIGVAATLLEEIILPLRGSSPEAFAKGIEMMREYDVGEDPGAWRETIDSLGRTAFDDYFYPVGQQQITELYEKKKTFTAG
jgi:hypothetical protein